MLKSPMSPVYLFCMASLGFSFSNLKLFSAFYGNADALLSNETEETYRIVTVCFDHEGNRLTPVGILPIYDTECPFHTLDIVKPAVTNTRADMSPFGQSVFADAVGSVARWKQTTFGNASPHLGLFGTTPQRIVQHPSIA